MRERKAERTVEKVVAEKKEARGWKKLRNLRKFPKQ